METRNVIFDFGNVLLDLDLGRTRRELEGLVGRNLELELGRLRQAGIFDAYEVGGIETDEFLGILGESVGGEVSRSQLVEAWNRVLLGMPVHRFELLLALRRRYRVFLLSNINDLHACWIEDHLRELLGHGDFRQRYFDGVYYSHWIRLRKPALDVYAYVLEDADIKPEETVFFDDLEENISGALAVGIRGYVHPVGQEIGDHVRLLGLL